MPFSQEIKTRAMVACGRRCVICHKFCGNNMEVHHIKAQADGGSNEFENAIPLCFDCHAEVRQYDPKHPKGIRFTEQELIECRENWYKKVETTGAVCAASEYLEMDQKTYYSLEKYLPRDGFNSLRVTDFISGYIQIEFIEKAELFTHLAIDPKYEYLDVDLESHKMRLAKIIADFIILGDPYLFSDDGKIVRIPHAWAHKNPTAFNKGVKALNDASIEVWNAYSDYIKLCRRKLQIKVQ